MLDAAVQEARTHPAFIQVLARGALSLKPPTGFLRDLVVEAKGEHAGRLDVKHGGITIITNIARTVGDRGRAPRQGTLVGWPRAASTGTLDAEVATELREAFRFLWQIRLRHQVAQVGRASRRTISSIPRGSGRWTAAGSRRRSG